jgi:uncharacterized OB-fold protein
MDRLLPTTDADTKPFWDAAMRGELLYQRCVSCATAQFPPRSTCGACHGGSVEWARARGEGRVASFTIVHRAPCEAFRAMAPYAIALIDMAEGFRVMMNVVDSDLSMLAIGVPIVVTFVGIADGIALPQARLAP